MRTIEQIGADLLSQDDRCTALPIFIVQQRREICGIEPDYAERIAWIDHEGDYAKATDHQARRLELLHDGGRDTHPWHRHGVVDRWEFVTACFTEQGCKDYIAVNGHNLKEPRIFAETGWRNDEWQTIRDHLKAAATATPQAAEGDGNG